MIWWLKDGYALLWERTSIWDRLEGETGLGCCWGTALVVVSSVNSHLMFGPFGVMKLFRFSGSEFQARGMIQTLGNFIWCSVDAWLVK